MHRDVRVPASLARRAGRPASLSTVLAAGLALVAGISACASSGSSTAQAPGTSAASAPLASVASPFAKPDLSLAARERDPRVGLGAGLLDAEIAISGMRLVSATPPPQEFVGVMNSDLAFKDQYVIQGNFNGFQVWDVSNPAAPELVKVYVCPASQSDVSVYGNLLFVSGEGLEGRLDCGTEGVHEAASPERLRGIRIFDISDIRNPKYIANVQTCRGSHTHSVLVDPDDRENVYIYVSGSAPVRPEEELPGCSGDSPDDDPNSALFRIEVIRVPLAHPEQAAIVSSPRIFEDLVSPPRHGPSEADKAELEAAKARGAFVAEVSGMTFVLPDEFSAQMLDGIVKQRGGSGAPTAADSALLRERLPTMFGPGPGGPGANRGPNQCHDITLYPEIGLAGGACEGYGLLLDITKPANPVRIAAVADSNFSYWHSATFNNSGSTILFTDEWGGGGGPKCRSGDPLEWGANAIFAVVDGTMRFKSYFKMPAPQTSEENCVAHNGSLIPIPGRDVMVQSWYQGGLSIFDFTDPANPVEIGYFDRGPVDAERMGMGGSWSVYWYNGLVVSSEIARGLDILELVPGPYLTRNEIDAAKSVRFDELNVQGQQRFEWPATFALARAYVDQLERSGGLSPDEVARTRAGLSGLESASGADREDGLTTMAGRLEELAPSSMDGAKVATLAGTLRDLSAL
jgi:hypothetical protein